MTRALFGLLLLLGAGSAMATEEPRYRVIETSGAFELRAYEPMTVAETWLTGSMREVSSAGFRLLANYIFGNNTSRAGGAEKIRMTAPVTREPIAETIEMTAPVGMARTGEQWRVHFVMPSRYTIDTLPTPNNPVVRLREVPATRYAVLRFSGWVTDEKRAAKTSELLAWLDGRGMTPKGTAELARYNPPWTLPFLRRNEVMVAY